MEKMAQAKARKYTGKARRPPYGWDCAAVWDCLVTPGRVDPVFIFQEYLISDMVLIVMAFSYDCLTASFSTLWAPCR